MQEYTTMLEQVSKASSNMPDGKRKEMDLLLTALAGKIDALTNYERLRKYYHTTAGDALNAQLNAIDKRTETAADDIMGAAEVIMDILGKEKPGPETNQKILDQVNKIFEACSFQDLITQHVTELRHLVTTVGDGFGPVTTDTSSGGKSALHKKKDTRPDSHLLNGPTTNI